MIKEVLIYGNLKSFVFSQTKNSERTKLQSTLVISNSKGLYETLRDIRSSTYQIYGAEEKTINRTTTFNRMNT